MRRRYHLRSVTALLAFSCALALPAAAQATQRPEVEINDALNSANGPTLSGDSWVGNLQTENDKDYFVFYTATTSQVHLTLFNTTLLDPDSSGGADIDMDLLNRSGDLVDYTDAVSGELGKTIDETVGRGTHFIEVEGNESGASYQVTATGTPAFILGPPPSTRCLDPHLRGKTLRQARRLLEDNHCEVGRVYRTDSHRRQYVYRQSGTPGFTYRNGHKIALHLRPHRRHHHHHG